METSEFMIVLLSPSWLNSEVCGWEYDGFKQHHGTARMLPISLRALSEQDIAKLSLEQNLRYEELRSIQQEKWQDLVHLEDRDLNRLLSDMARALKTILQNPPAKNPPTPEPDQSAPAAPKPPQGTPVRASPERPPINADYLFPSQGGCQLQLSTGGLYEVRTANGTIVFAIRAFSLRTEFKGGMILTRQLPYATETKRPLAKITQLPIGNRETELLVDTIGDAMRGQPLCEAGESGHVMLFDFASEEDIEPSATGSLEVTYAAIDIDEDQSHVTLTGEEKKQKNNKKVLASLVMETLFKEPISVGVSGDD